MVTVRAGRVVSSRDEDRGKDGEGGDVNASPPTASAGDSSAKSARAARALALKQKLRDVSQQLATQWEPPPPTAILSSGLDEAKAYVPATRPREASLPAEPWDRERVRLVDPRTVETITLDKRTLEAARRRADAMERREAAAREVEAAREAEVRRAAEREVRWKPLAIAGFGIGFGLLMALVVLVAVTRLSGDKGRSASPSASASVSVAPSVSADVTAAATGSAATTGSAAASAGPMASAPSSEPSSEPLSVGGDASPAVVTSSPRSPTSLVAPTVRPRASGAPKASSAPSTSPTRPPELVN